MAVAGNGKMLLQIVELLVRVGFVVEYCAVDTDLDDVNYEPCVRLLLGQGKAHCGTKPMTKGVQEVKIDDDHRSKTCCH